MQAGIVVIAAVADAVDRAAVRIVTTVSKIRIGSKNALDAWRLIDCEVEITKSKQ